MKINVIHSERIEEEVDIKTPFYYKEKGTVSFTIGEITDKKHTYIHYSEQNSFEENSVSYEILQEDIHSCIHWYHKINNECSKEEFYLAKKQAVDFINSL
jgi:hypothetical protein